MPILAPIAEYAGASCDLVSIAHRPANGLANLAKPNSAVVMRSFAVRRILYEQWLRFTWIFVLAVIITAVLSFAPSVMAQGALPGPPAVGVVTAERRTITESTELNGRVQAQQRVDLLARVTAFLEELNFQEGTEVGKGDLLYRLERGPFAADLEVKEAAIAQAQAQLENAEVALERAEELLRRQTGPQVAVDNARAAYRSAAAQLKAAQAQRLQSQINLDYTEIRAPIDGRIGRTSVTVGNVVGPASGILATIVSQDPMYMTFPIPMRRALELRDRYAARGGFEAVAIRLRLPDGRIYGHDGKLDFADISVARETDTITLRGTVPNPPLAQAQGYGQVRELANDEFVRVLLEAVEPEQVVAVPRAAVLSDQQGDYVYVVDDQNMARQRRVRLGQSTPDTAAVVEGLKPGERVIVEGIQRVRPDIVVAPAPASPSPGRS